jgi:hypothetical protein
MYKIQKLKLTFAGKKFPALDIMAANLKYLPPENKAILQVETKNDGNLEHCCRMDDSKALADLRKAHEAFIFYIQAGDEFRRVQHYN